MKFDENTVEIGSILKFYDYEEALPYLLRYHKETGNPVPDKTFYEAHFKYDVEIDEISRALLGEVRNLGVFVQGIYPKKHNYYSIPLLHAVVREVQPKGNYMYWKHGWLI